MVWMSYAAINVLCGCLCWTASAHSFGLDPTLALSHTATGTVLYTLLRVVLPESSVTAVLLRRPRSR